MQKARLQSSVGRSRALQPRRMTFSGHCSGYSINVTFSGYCRVTFSMVRVNIETGFQRTHSGANNAKGNLCLLPTLVIDKYGLFIFKRELFTEESRAGYYLLFLRMNGSALRAEYFWSVATFLCRIVKH